MNDDAVVKIMQSLGLDYSPAIRATERFEKTIADLNKQLAIMKANAIQGAKDINKAFVEQLGSLGGQKAILDQYGNPLKIIQSEVQKTSNDIINSFKPATNSLREHKQNLEDVKKQYNIFASEMQRRTSWFLSGSLFYGALKGAKEAVSTISEVEMGMVEIARVMEDSTFNFQAYRDELLQLGIEYGQSFATVQDIALRWAQAGYGVRDSLENTRTSLLALNTAELDAKNATESLIGIMAQWQLTSADLPLLLDKINKTADDFTLTSQDLVEGLLRSSSAAKIMNLSIDETIALLTVMREASGRTGREVGNALNSILSYIQRPGSINVLENLGIRVFADEARTQFRNVMQIFQDIASKWSTASDSIKDGFVQAADEAGLFSEELATALGLQEQWNDLQARDIAQASAGVYRRNYFIAMIERLSSAQEVLNGLMNAAGYSQAENTRTMDTLEKKYQSLKTSAEQLAVALGDAGLLDVLKSLIDSAGDFVQGLAKMDAEARTFLLTALELITISKAVRDIGGMFGINATLGTAISVLPGWTKLLAIIPAVAGAVGLYAYNLNKASDATNGLRSKQEDLTKTFNSQLEAADQTQNSLLEQAKTAEILADKLVELNEKENLNASEKAQLKDIAEKLNATFSNLGLEIDSNTGKIIGNTKAIYDNIAALKEQAIAQGYQARMQATASTYVEQELLLGQTRNAIELARAELQALKTENRQALQEIEMARSKAAQEGWGSYRLGKTIADINKKYGVTNIEQQIREKEKQISALTDLAREQEKILLDLEKELDEWADKAIESSSKIPSLTDYVPSVGTPKTSTTKTSSAYKNEALENALRLLQHKKRLNQISIEEEIGYLNQIKSLYVKTANELMDINERIYDAEQTLLKQRLNHSINWINEQKSLGQLTLDEEIAAWERILSNQSDNQEAVKQATVNLYRLRNQLMTESYSQEENYIKHLTKLGILSAEEQIEKYRQLYQYKANSLQEEQARVENLFDLYKRLISDQQRTIKVAHDERISQIEEEAERRKQAQKQIIEGIEKELELLDRQEQEYDHEKRMDDLRAQLAYWQVRTSEQARQKVAEITKQIEEEERKYAVELRRQELEEKKKLAQEEIDNIEARTKEEREKLEKAYYEIEIAFDEHSINMIALASTMWQGAYEEFEKNYIIPIQNALRNMDLDTVDSILSGVDDFAQDVFNRTYNTTNAQVYRLANQILEYKRQYEYGGDKSAAERAKPIYAELEKLNPSVAEVLHRSNTKQAEEFIKSLPKMHTGGKTLSYGAVYMKPGELVFPPDLSIKLEGLIAALYHRPINQTSTITDNRKDVRIDTLLNIENNYMEDEVDSEILSRNLQRALASLI